MNLRRLAAIVVGLALPLTLVASAGATDLASLNAAGLQSEWQTGDESFRARVTANWTDFVIRITEGPSD